MKKKILYILMMGIIFLIPKNVFALTVSTSCSSSSSATLGNTVTVTVRGNASDSVMWDLSIGYDSSKLQYIGGSSIHYISDNFSSSTSLTYKFKTIALGSAYVKVANAEVATATGESASSKSGSCNINVVKPVPTAPKNSDNNLKSLSVEGATLSPEFNKDTLEYSVTLTSDTTKVKVNAEKNDSKASVSGTGEIEVKEGDNKLEIVVTAENGSKKTYVINATVQEKAPIIVKVNKEEYSIIRKKDVLTVPDGYEETKVTINDEEIPAYKNEITGYTLVGLKSQDNKNAWYVYDENKLTYTKYIELKSEMVRLVVLNPKESDVPYRYYKTTFDYNGEKIDGYTFDEGSSFRLIYGLNILTGEKSFYLYDINEKTVQRFYNDQVLIYIDLVKKCKILLLSCAAALFALFLSVIVLLSKNVKFKKTYLENVDNNVKEQKNNNEIEYKDIEGTTILEPVEEPKISKKELKKQKKEEKKNKKQKEKTFLDE